MIERDQYEYMSRVTFLPPTPFIYNLSLCNPPRYKDVNPFSLTVIMANDTHTYISYNFLIRDSSDCNHHFYD